MPHEILSWASHDMSSDDIINQLIKWHFLDDGNQEEYDQDEYIEFLNHLSDINAAATRVSESEDTSDSDDDPEREAEVRLQVEQGLV